MSNRQFGGREGKRAEQYIKREVVVYEEDDFDQTGPLEPRHLQNIPAQQQQQRQPPQPRPPNLRPPTSFELFCQDKQAEFRELFRGITNDAIINKCHRIWNSWSSDQKSDYLTDAIELSKDFRAKHPNSDYARRVILRNEQNRSGYNEHTAAQERPLRKIPNAPHPVLDQRPEIRANETRAFQNFSAINMPQLNAELPQDIRFRQLVAAWNKKSYGLKMEYYDIDPMAEIENARVPEDDNMPGTSSGYQGQMQMGNYERIPENVHHNMPGPSYRNQPNRQMGGNERRQAVAPYNVQGPRFVKKRPINKDLLPEEIEYFEQVREESVESARKSPPMLHRNAFPRFDPRLVQQQPQHSSAYPRIPARDGSLAAIRNAAAAHPNPNFIPNFMENPPYPAKLVQNPRLVTSSGQKLELGQKRKAPPAPEPRRPENPASISLYTTQDLGIDSRSDQDLQDPERLRQIIYQVLSEIELGPETMPHELDDLEPTIYSEFLSKLSFEQTCCLYLK